MIQTPIDCPFCNVTNTGATVRSAVIADRYRIIIFATCNTCSNGFSMRYKSRDKVAEYDHELGRECLANIPGTSIPSHWERLFINPQKAKPKSVNYLDPRVQQALAEAEANFSDGRWASAAIGYRRALERCLKIMHPDATGSLFSRIRELEKANAIPKSLTQLMDNIRFLGNDGAHELEDPEKDDVIFGRDFTILLLTYLVELPERVKIAAAKRES